MPVRLAAWALAFLVLAGGCGGGDDGRDAVADYIEEANAIQRELRTPLAVASRAYVDFSSGDADLADTRPRLAESTRLLATLEGRLARLRPPADAQRLHSLLLELVAAQAAVAREVALLAEFLPRFERQHAVLRQAEARLRTALAAQRPSSTAAALDDYSRDVAAVFGALRALEPPAVMAAAHRSQLDTLTRVRSSAAALATAVRKGDEADVPARLQQLSDDARRSSSLATQRSHIAAVKLYNERVRSVNELATAVDRERIRLQSALG
jgi:hypothetical protein